MEIIKREKVNGIELFMKRPEKGNKVKVYLYGNKVAYGIVEDVISSESRGREMAVLKESEIEFNLMECNFCLDSNSVIFK